MRIDLHIHTSPRSACSYLHPQAAIQAAERLKLDGICLTEHQVVWDPADVTQLVQAGQTMIFRGNEFTSNQGDVLVFGFYEDIKDVLVIQELRAKVKAAGGYMIAAHPFRGFKAFGIGQLQMTVEQACRRKVFEFVDAIEVGNGKLSDDENAMAQSVAKKLGFPGTGGSDAHRVDEIGKWTTVFENPIRNDCELVEALHTGRFTAVKQQASQKPISAASSS